jgi:two-component system sensor histidine kinase PilS (NtrC family)
MGKQNEQTLPAASNRDEVAVIKSLIAFRVVAVSFFLGTVIIFQNSFGTFLYPIPISLLIATTYLLSIIYLGVLGIAKRYATYFVYAQLAVDLLIETGIMYYTGGGNSPFTFLYILTIVSSVVIAQPNGGYVLASGASILYGLLVNLESYGVISPPHLIAAMEDMERPQGYVFFMTLVHIMAFFLVAFLSDFLSRRLKSALATLVSKSSDLIYLQAFHQNVIANMGSGFLALDMEGRIVSTNHAAETILERDEISILKKRLKDALPALAEESKSIMNGKSEREYSTPDGKSKLLSITLSQFKNSYGERLGTILIFQDITDFKKMEEAVSRSERLAAMGRMAAGLAHEIRNPLGSISGSIQIMRDAERKGSAATMEKLMAIVLRETDRLNATISRFLSYASPNTAKEPNVNLSALISDAVTLFSNDARYKGITPVLDLDDRIRCDCDVESVKQVFWNLLLNAAQSMPDGGEIRIAVKPVTSEWEISSRCLITFADTGIGIPNDSLEKIFEPFYTSKEGGTGLGLPLVQKVIESHDGAITVQSEVGKGTVFSILLPIYPIAL